MMNDFPDRRRGLFHLHRGENRRILFRDLIEIGPSIPNKNRPSCLRPDVGGANPSFLPLLVASAGARPSFYFSVISFPLSRSSPPFRRATRTSCIALLASACWTRKCRPASAARERPFGNATIKRRGRGERWSRGGATMARWGGLCGKATMGSRWDGSYVGEAYKG